MHCCHMQIYEHLHTKKPKVTLKYNLVWIYGDWLQSDSSLNLANPVIGQIKCKKESAGVFLPDQIYVSSHNCS